MNSFFQPASRRNVDLDFLRGIAILSVVGYHVYFPPASLPILAAVALPFQLLGHRGVDLFFVLSGFLVGGLLLKEYQNGHLNQRRFLVRRILKIWPMYYFFIGMQLLLRHHPWNTFLFQNLLHVQNYTGTSLAQTWSLAIEEHFYLALALFLAWACEKGLTAQRLLAACSALCVVALALRSFDVYRGNLSGAHGYTQDRIDNLLFGVMLAILFWLLPQTFERLTRRRWPLALISGATLLSLFWFEKNPAWSLTLGYTLIPIGLTALLALTYRHAAALNRWLGYRLIASVGLYSYGIYLWFSVTRAPMRHLVEHWPTGSAAGWLAAVAVQFAAAVLLGAAMTMALEFPISRLRDRWFPASPEQMATTAAPRFPSTALPDSPRDAAQPVSQATA